MFQNDDDEKNPLDEDGDTLHTPRPTVPEIGESGDEGTGAGAAKGSDNPLNAGNTNPLLDEDPKTPSFEDDADDAAPADDNAGEGNAGEAEAASGDTEKPAEEAMDEDPFAAPAPEAPAPDAEESTTPQEPGPETAAETAAETATPAAEEESAAESDPPPPQKTNRSQEKVGFLFGKLQ